MMKYTGKYYMVLSLLLRKHLINQFGKEITSKALKGAKPIYKDKTWDFNFENKHKDGIYYHFTRCPLNDFARKNGFLEILPVCCEIDHYMTEAKHGVLHRDYTLATGGSICDYWIVPDKIKNPK